MDTKQDKPRYTYYVYFFNVSHKRQLPLESLIVESGDDRREDWR
jgi:hypothetical protein